MSVRGFPLSNTLPPAVLALLGALYCLKADPSDPAFLWFLGGGLVCYKLGVEVTHKRVCVCELR